MKRFLFSAFSLLLIAVWLQAQNTQFSSGAEYCSMKKIRGPVPLKSADFSPNSPKHSFDVQNYTLNLDIFNCYTSPYSHYFTASNTVTFRVDTALSQISLNAENASLVIDSVSDPCVSFTHGNDILEIQLDQTYNPNDEITLTIYYKHNNVEEGGFYANNGFVFTDCEPEGARKWFPCWDKPGDKATLDLTARVPLDVKLGSNGRLQDSTIVGNAIYYHWVSIHPVATYLVVITSKVNYNLDIVYWHKLSNPDDSVPIRFYFNAGENPGPMENIIGDMTTYYSEAFGEHPFEKNGFATLNNEFYWGGMENQTLTSLCPGCWSEGLLAHEFAHQWFGDMITCGTWADIFLNEGFATWIEMYWNEGKFGYNYYHDEVESAAGYYLNNNPGWAISEPDWAINTPPLNVLFNYAVTYLKGACVLHQLRYVLGDSLFFAGMNAYATDVVNFKYQSSVIIDFRDKMEETSGQDLDWFFDAWTFLPNHPDYENTYYFEDLGNGNWNTYFLAKQVQTNTGFFPMPIELRIFFQGGQDTIIRVMNDYNEQQFTFTFDQQPAIMFFDPHNDIVLKQASLSVGEEEFIANKEHGSLVISPNPATGSTSIRYSLDDRANADLRIMDPSGKVVKVLVNSMKEKGNHLVTFDTGSLKPGIYYCRLTAGDSSLTRKLVVSR
jgi:aminopeptidase N